MNLYTYEAQICSLLKLLFIFSTKFLLCGVWCTNSFPRLFSRVVSYQSITINVHFRAAVNGLSQEEPKQQMLEYVCLCVYNKSRQPSTFVYCSIILEIVQSLTRTRVLSAQISSLGYKVVLCYVAFYAMCSVYTLHTHKCTMKYSVYNIIVQLAENYHTNIKEGIHSNFTIAFN